MFSLEVRHNDMSHYLKFQGILELISRQLVTNPQENSMHVSVIKVQGHTGFCVSAFFQKNMSKISKQQIRGCSKSQAKATWIGTNLFPLSLLLLFRKTGSEIGTFSQYTLSYLTLPSGGGGGRLVLKSFGIMA